jgi:ribosomal 50S subunit-recycling heat shock protein
MRLDKYLKVSRIIKRRTVANNACDADRVMVNGREAKASYQVKIGDIVEISLGNKNVKFRVDSINEVVKKESASEMYTILE